MFNKLKENSISFHTPVLQYKSATTEEYKITREEFSTYFINSNSPSGGTKLTVFSELNLVKFTHWWKVTSSSSIVLPLQRISFSNIRIKTRKKLKLTLHPWTHIQINPNALWIKYQICEIQMLHVLSLKKELPISVKNDYVITAKTCTKTWSLIVQ